MEKGKAKGMVELSDLLWNRLRVSTKVERLFKPLK